MEREEMIRGFLEFFRNYSDSKGSRVYKNRIKDVLTTVPKRSISIDWAHLNSYNPELAKEVIDNPEGAVLAAEDALRTILIEDFDEEFTLHPRFYNLSKTFLVKEIGSEHINKLIQVDGIITRVSEVKPYVNRTVFVCKDCGNEMVRVQRPFKQIAKPGRCENCGSRNIDLDVNKSSFINLQTFRLQDRPESLRGGQMPRFIDAILLDDLVDAALPGDRVIITGILRVILEAREKRPIFKKILEVNHIEQLSKEIEELEITPEDEQKIKELAKRADIIDAIVDSIAPAIYGLKEEKKGIALALFGGVTKQLPDGTKLRGESHVLLVGDPGVAKCVDYSTRVLLADGSLEKIGKIVEEAIKLAERDGTLGKVDDGVYAPVDLEIHALDAGTLKVIKAKADIAWKRKAPEKMLKVKTKTGREISVTPTHPFFTFENGQFRTKSAGDLNAGDLIAVPRGIGHNPDIDVLPYLGEILKEVRESLELSQFEVGIDRSTYLHYERNDRRPSRKDLMIVAETFEETACSRGTSENIKKKIELLKLLAGSDILWDEIEEIEVYTPEDKWVYDLQVPEHHNFIANDIFVHNSQLLRYIANLAPRAIYTSGKSSSAAGLTAAAVRDELTGSWVLEAGVLVLADGGIACLHPDSRVLVNSKYVRIEELFDPSQSYKAKTKDGMVDIQEICEDVVSLSLRNMGTTKTKATILRRKRWKGELLRIRFRSGNEITLTPDHLLIDGETLEWKEAQRFKAGDKVVAPLKLPGIKEKVYILDVVPDNWKVMITKEEGEELTAEILKRFKNLAEFNREYNISEDVLSGRSQMSVRTFKQVLKDLGIYKKWRRRPLAFGRKSGEDKLKVATITPELAYFLGFVYGNGRIREDKRRATIFIAQSTTHRGQIEAIRGVLSTFYEGDLKEYNKINGGDIIFRIDSHILVHLYKYLIQNNMKNLFKLDDEALKAFIAGTFDSSGCISIKASNRDKGEYQIAHIEFPLSNDEEKDRAFMLALKRFDIYSQLIRGRSVNKIRITGREDIENLIEAVKRYSVRVRDLPIERRGVPSSGDRIPSKRDYFLDEIIDVEKVPYDGYVYDLYVPEFHNFVAEGVIVHNCIDEFDKMNDKDRSAIHEALEQQSVSISKAGITATLNSRTTVIAAANPKYGRFNRLKPLPEQLDLPPTLLSRFDLIFVLIDEPNERLDSEIARHILKVRRGEAEAVAPKIPYELLKKYIAYARKNVHPVLSREAMDEILHYYVKMRRRIRGGNEEGVKPIPITPRQLEALIRLSEARARMRLSEVVTREDAQDAIRLIEYTLKQVAMDEEGFLDISILEVGKSSRQINKIDRILEIIRELENFTENGAPIDEILKEAGRYNIHKSEARKIIERLMTDGMVYMPKDGFYRVA